MHSSENDAVLITVCEPLNHIYQDTKSARLIAVCKLSITLNKFGKRARGCCVRVFLFHELITHPDKKNRIIDVVLEPVARIFLEFLASPRSCHGY